MNKLENYMDASSVINDPMPLREIHAIRLMIYDETKDMTPAERTAYYNGSIMEAQKKYNFKIMVKTG